jgi:dipeptidyl aminopeptidase/acylaminoacyl peptidase
VKYVYRKPGSKEWTELTPYTDLVDFQPLAIDATTNSLYATRKLKDHWALSRISLDDTPTETVVVTDPMRDVDGVQTVGASGHVIGYQMVGDEQPVYTDPAYQSLALALRSALPNHAGVKFLAENTDRSKIVLFAGRDNDPGRYLLFNKTTKALGELVPARPNLSGRELATVTSMTFLAADGTTISARLFLPPHATARSLPTVIFSGGDSGYKDGGGFEWLAQFLAARGYAVFEPQFRGFGGSDSWFNTVGFKQWRTSASDISAAARYIASQGVADPARLAVLGWSHSGYAALLSAETDPSLYKAVIAIAPITNLATYVEDWSNYTAGKRMRDAVGTAQADASPSRRANAIEAPVLLFHGTMDVNERVDQSRGMRDALQKAGKPVELVEFEGLGRELEDSAARAQMLLKIGQLLDRTIGH